MARTRKMRRMWLGREIVVAGLPPLAEPMRPKFCVGPHVAQGKIYGQSDFKYVILKYYYLKLFNLKKTIT